MKQVVIVRILDYGLHTFPNVCVLQIRKGDLLFPDVPAKNSGYHGSLTCDAEVADFGHPVNAGKRTSGPEWLRVGMKFDLFVPGCLVTGSFSERCGGVLADPVHFRGRCDCKSGPF